MESDCQKALRADDPFLPPMARRPAPAAWSSPSCWPSLPDLGDWSTTTDRLRAPNADAGRVIGRVVSGATRPGRAGAEIARKGKSPYGGAPGSRALADVSASLWPLLAAGWGARSAGAARASAISSTRRRPRALAHQAKGHEGRKRSALPRPCGCTDDDCRQCIDETGSPCTWVEEDLCSACVGEQVAKRGKSTKRKGTKPRWPARP